MKWFYKIPWAIRAIIFKPMFKSLGWFSYIGQPTFIMGSSKTNIGSRVRIFPGIRLEVHKDGELTIEDNVTIGQDFHVTCASHLRIESGCTISGNVMVTDIDHEYRDLNSPIFDQGFIVNKTAIGKNCFIGFGVRIQAGTVLGKNCVVGTNSVARGVFPDNCVIVGAPARIVRRYNPDTNVWERYDDGDV